jgi:hypothetical protein
MDNHDGSGSRSEPPSFLHRGLRWLPHFVHRGEAHGEISPHEIGTLNSRHMRGHALAR